MPREPEPKIPTDYTELINEMKKMNNMKIMNKMKMMNKMEKNKIWLMKMKNQIY